jgi:hypothetical protein
MRSLTPVPKGTKGVVPVGRGGAPRSCSPDTPKRGEYPTRSLVDGATRPEGTQVRTNEVSRVVSGDYTPQDRRSTNIGLLHKGEYYSQTVNTAQRVDRGDYKPQDRRSTNIGLLHKGEYYSQTVNTARRVDRGDYKPQDRRRTKIGLLTRGGKK